MIIIFFNVGLQNPDAFIHCVPQEKPSSVEAGIAKTAETGIFSTAVFSLRQGDGILKAFDTSVLLFFINYFKLSGGQNYLWLKSC